MKKVLFLISLFSFLLAGCKDRMELEEMAYVIAIGVDKGGPNMLTITYQIANTENYGAGQSGGTSGRSNEKSEIITFSAPEFITARDLATASVTRKLNFSHTRILIVSEEVVKSEESYKAIMASLRDREFRRYTYILVTKEKASEFIRNNNPKLEASPHKFYDYLSRRWVQTGLVPISTVNEFAARLELKSSLFLAAYGSTIESETKEFGYESNYLPGEIKTAGGNPTQVIGSAVFKKEKMIGALTGEETRLVLLMRPQSKASNMLVTFPDPMDSSKRVSARLLRESRPKIKVDLNGSVPKIDVTVNVGLRLLAVPSKIDYAENIQNQEKLKKSYAAFMEGKAKDLVKKTQQEFKGDPFLWALAARRKFSTLQSFWDYNWMEKYPDAKVTVKFDVKLTGTGKQLAPPK